MPPANKDQLLQFQTEIEKIVIATGSTYMEAILLFCEQNDYEVEKIPRLLSGVLKARVAEEASGLRLIKKEKGAQKLPV